MVLDSWLAPRCRAHEVQRRSDAVALLHSGPLQRLLKHFRAAAAGTPTPSSNPTQSVSFKVHGEPAEVSLPTHTLQHLLKYFKGGNAEQRGIPLTTPTVA